MRTGVIHRSCTTGIPSGVSSSILAGLALAAACALATDVAAILKLTGAVQDGAGIGHIAPWLAVAIAGGMTAQILAVRGLQEGDAVPVIALTGVTANVANIGGGILVFADPLAHGPLSFMAQSLAFGLVVVGAALVPSPVTTPAAAPPRRAALA
jgi:hypothetical protein